ncbi:hypothetical protein E4T48_06247 [Aureobasidium sp. EXF-10727]|nr:hypothetical protein E4T48_06247 [Aureobasidium sp. EXF-10727]
MSFSIKPVKVTLAPSIAKAMISARWADPHWKALFIPGTSCATVIHETAARLPKNLSSGRATKRHQVAISSTGEVVAYARWILPEHLAAVTPVVWPEAQVAEPTAEQTEKFEQMFRDVTDDGKIKGLRMDMMEFRSTPLEEVDAKINEGGPFLCSP